MVLGGGPTGNVLEWHNRQDGWRNIEGTDANGVNGLAVSDDQEWWFIACWGTKEVLKIPRGSGYPTRESVFTDLLNDNITWALDRRHLLVTGQDADAGQDCGAIAEGSTSHRISFGCWESQEAGWGAPWAASCFLRTNSTSRHRSSIRFSAPWWEL
jgi:hypothetical protein